MKQKVFTTKNLTVTAVLTAISFVLYMLGFPIAAIFPSWLKLQFSDMPALIGGFMMGPGYGCAIIVIKCLLHIPLGGTGGVGELADIIVGVSFVLPASLFYKFFRSRKGALSGMGIGAACATVASLIANAYILIPFYAKVIPEGMDALVGMLSGLFPSVTLESFMKFYLFAGVLPFNVLRLIVCSAITFFVYKHLHRLIDRMFDHPKKKKATAAGSQTGGEIPDTGGEELASTQNQPAETADEGEK